MPLSTKLLIRKERTLKNWEHPIYLRITINRETKSISTKKTVQSGNWDEKKQLVKTSDSASSITNELLKEIKKRVAQFLLKKGKNGEAVTFDEIKEIVDRLTVTYRLAKPKPTSPGQPSDSVLDKIFSVLETELDTKTFKNIKLKIFKKLGDEKRHKEILDETINSVL